MWVWLSHILTTYTEHSVTSVGHAWMSSPTTVDPHPHGSQDGQQM